MITTNYDRLLEKAFENVPHLVEVQPTTTNPDGRDWLQLEQRPLAADVVLYKIHGSFPSHGGGTEQPRPLITEDDYIQFLTLVGREAGGIPTAIKDKLQRSTLLFLGYGLEDWDFRTLPSQL